MSDVKIVRTTATKPSGPTAADVFRMPTQAEFVAAGYKLERYAELQAERDDLARRFAADPEFRAAAIAHYQERQRAKARGGTGA